MKNDEGRTLVSRRAIAVVGMLWLLGSLWLGAGMAAPHAGGFIEVALALAALGAIPAVVLVLVWSYLESGLARLRDATRRRRL